MWKFSSSEALCQRVSYSRKKYSAFIKERVSSRFEESWIRRRELAKKKRGRVLTLGNLDEKLQQYIRVLRKAGTPVNGRVVLATAEGIVKATDRTLLFENGGHMHAASNSPSTGPTHSSEGWVM